MMECPVTVELQLCSDRLFSLSQAKRVRNELRSLPDRRLVRDNAVVAEMDEYPDVGIGIDTGTLKISIFVPFSYYDFTKSDLGRENYDIEEIEQGKRTQLLESSFTWYLASV